MALTWQARLCFGAMAAPGAVGLAPDHDKIVKRPMRKRLDMGPPKGLVGKVPAVATVDRQVPTRDGKSIRIRIYRRHQESSDVPIVYAHGGGFVVGGLASCDHICRRIAAESGAVVVSVEYRLAPEHAFPGPLHDVQDSAVWVLESATELGIDPERLIVAGDSAGGNLASSLCLLMRDHGQAPAGQILIYPSLDCTLSSAGMRAYTGIGLTSKDCRQVVDYYLQGQDPRDSFASPLLAQDFHGLPPTLLVTVEHDPLRDDGHLYAARCREAGIPVVHLDIPDQVHGSLSTPRLFRGIDAIYVAISEFVRNSAHVHRG